MLDNSEAPVLEEAVLEWEVYDCEEDEALQSSCICICSKEDIRYLFTISKHPEQEYPVPIDLWKVHRNLSVDTQVPGK
ncbi:MAG: hypothetical protein FWG10_06210 [Eubacteriaceae bacterium]|nr:hypothetical protein [Eubacteriaceae bacterium]